MRWNCLSKFQLCNSNGYTSSHNSLLELTPRWTTLRVTPLGYHPASMRFFTNLAQLQMRPQYLLASMRFPWISHEYRCSLDFTQHQFIWVLQHELPTGYLFVDEENTSIPIDQFIARKYARYQMMITLSIQGPITWLIACVVELPVKIPDMQL